MTDITKRMLIAGVVAVLLIGGAVTALVLTDDDEPDGPLVATAAELDDRIDLEEMVGGFLDRLLAEGESGGRLGDLFQQFLEPGTKDRQLDGLADRLPDLLERFLEPGMDGNGGQRLGDLFERFLDDLRSDLEPVSPNDPPQAAPLEPDEARPRPAPDTAPRPDRIVPDDRVEGFRFRLRPDATPFFGEGFRFPGDLFADSPLEEFLADGRLSREEADELQRWLEDRLGSGGFFFGTPEGPFGPPADPGFMMPFGDLPLDRLLEDGQISPEEARRLRRMFEERFGSGTFSSPIDPAPTDRPTNLLDGLRALPLDEFLADGSLSLPEQQAIRSAVDQWLQRVFSRFGVPTN